MELKIISYIHCNVLASYCFASSVASQIAKHTWQQEPFSSNLGMHLVLGIIKCYLNFAKRCRTNSSEFDFCP